MPRTMLSALAAVALLATAVHAADIELKTDDDKALYALGLALSNTIASYNLSPAELEVVKLGLTDAVLKHDRKVDPATWFPAAQALGQKRAAAAAEVEKKSAQTFLDKMAAEKGATKTASGLIYMEVKAGTGDTPKATDKVKVHYTGTLTDGSVFDSSVQRGEPATFPLNGVIPCWTEGVQQMKVGGKAKLVCPPALAYGDQGAPPKIKPGAALVFEVELLDIVK